MLRTLNFIDRVIDPTPVLTSIVAFLESESYHEESSARGRELCKARTPRHAWLLVENRAVCHVRHRFNFVHVALEIGVIIGKRIGYLIAMLSMHTHDRE